MNFLIFDHFSIVVIDKQKTQFASDSSGKQKIQQIQLMRERNPIANHFAEQD